MKTAYYFDVIISIQKTIEFITIYNRSWTNEIINIAPKQYILLYMYIVVILCVVLKVKK